MKLAVILGVGAAIAGGAFFGLRGDDPYELVAEVPDASGLTGGSQVRVGGVPVGSVRGVEVDESENHARVTMHLDPEVAPVGSGVALKLRPANLLGEKFVDLDTGDHSEPVPSGHLVPGERVKVTVELDDLLNSLDSPTRAGLSLLLSEGGRALDLRGSDLRKALSDLPPTVAELDELFAGLAADNRALGSLLERSQRVIGAAAAKRAELGELVGAATAALEATASRREQLAATIQTAPGTMRQLRASLTDLEEAGRELVPAAKGLVRTAPALNTALAALPGFQRAADPALRALEQAAPDLTRLGEQGRSPIRKLSAALRSLESVAKESPELISSIEKGAGVDLLGVIQGWTQALQYRDGINHMFRVSAVLPPELADEFANYVISGGDLLAPGPREANRKAGKKPVRVKRTGDGEKGSTAKPKAPGALGKVLGDTLGKIAKPSATPRADGNLDGLLGFLMDDE